MIARGALCLILLGGCQAVEVPPGLTPPDAGAPLDYNHFVCHVMPTLVQRCSFSACHGDAAQALRVYSAGKLRLSEPLTRADRDAAITAAEIDANYESAVGVLLGATPAQRASLDLQYLPLLQRPLAAAFGGAEHQGVAMFPLSPAARPSADPAWNQLAAWVVGASQDPPDEACADFFTALNVRPR